MPVAQCRENPRHWGCAPQEELLHGASLELSLHRAISFLATEESPGWGELGYADLRLLIGCSKNHKRTYSLCFGRSSLRSLCSIRLKEAFIWGRVRTPA